MLGSPTTPITEYGMKMYKKANKAHNYEFRIIIIGNSGVGKTTTLLTATENISNKVHLATIGVDIKLTSDEVNGKTVKLQIYDTAGQEKYRSIIKQYYRGNNGIIVMFDITDIISFNNIFFWIEEIKRYVDNEYVLFIVGNKSDKEAYRKVQYETAKKFADKYNANYYEVSAFNKKSVDDLFRNISKELVNMFPDKMVTSKNRFISTSINDKFIVGKKMSPTSSNLSCC